MAKLLTILTLILAILLFPPASLALISNNAVPGDATYPIKRGLEEVILKIASIHPASKAWFSAARSDRRFQELNILVTKGKQIDQTLGELVEQTEIAASQITQVTDKNQKAQLVERLTESIKKYDEGLAKLPPPITAPTIKPDLTPIPTVTPTPTATLVPIATPQPTSTPQPSPPPPPPPSGCDAIEDPIERARCRLQEIQQGLGVASQDISPQEIDRGRGKGRGSDRRGGEREDERDNSERDSDRGSNRDRGQGRDR